MTKVQLRSSLEDAICRTLLEAGGLDDASVAYLEDRAAATTVQVTYEEMFVAARIREAIGNMTLSRMPTPDETCAQLTQCAQQIVNRLQADAPADSRTKVEFRQDPENPTNYILYVTPRHRILHLSMEDDIT